MALWHLVLLAALSDLPAVEIETLKGDRHAGALAELSSTALRLKQGEAVLDLSLADVVGVRFTSPTVPEPFIGPRVVLVDGTRLTCSEFSVVKGEARLATMQFGTLTLPMARVAQVRFGLSTGKLDEAWNALAARESKTDLLIVKKEDVLDHLDGVVGDVGEKVGFLLDNEEVPVSREKVYGIFFRRKTSGLPKPAIQVDLAGGDLLQGVTVVWNGTDFKLRLAAGPEMTLPASSLSALDFSAGKIRYLSQLEPREVKSVPFFDTISYREYRRDRSLDGTPLSLAGKTYARGLAINSKTTLRYRIAGEYTRFQGVMGIDDSVRGYGDVHVVVSGDGKPLLEADVKGRNAPQPFSIDVTGVRDLEILVDFGGDANIGDHLDLADARLIK
jgi:NPCBM/NEW2 domain